VKVTRFVNEVTASWKRCFEPAGFNHIKTERGINMKKHVAGQVRSIVVIILAASLLLGMTVAVSAEGGASKNDTVIDINSATADEIAGLPGIGEKKAAAIVRWREGNGGFSIIEDIMNVEGIGLKTFEKIQPHIVVRQSPAAGR